MTTPLIDVDYATPVAELVAGPAQVDVALPGVPGPAGSQAIPVTFGTAGPVTGPQVGTIPFFPRINGRIVRVTLAVGAQTSGASRCDVNIGTVGGAITSIYTDQNQRPNCTGTGLHFDDGGTIGAGDFTENQFITVDRDSVGVGVEDFIVTVEYEPTP